MPQLNYVRLAPRWILFARLARLFLESLPALHVQQATMPVERVVLLAQQLSLVVYNAQTMAPVAHCVTQETTLLKAEVNVFVLCLITKIRAAQSVFRAHPSAHSVRPALKLRALLPVIPAKLDSTYLLEYV